MRAGNITLFLFLLMQVGFGQVANFTVTDIAGKKHDLYTYLNEGKYVVVDFTAYN